jgi:hypothetical protein
MTHVSSQDPVGSRSSLVVVVAGAGWCSGCLFLVSDSTFGLVTPTLFSKKMLEAGVIPSYRRARRSDRIGWFLVRLTSNRASRGSWVRSRVRMHPVLEGVPSQTSVEEEGVRVLLLDSQNHCTDP